MIGGILFAFAVFLLILLGYLSEVENQRFFVKLGAGFSLGGFIITLFSLLSFDRLHPYKNLGGILGYKISSMLLKSLGPVITYYLVFSFIVLFSYMLFKDIKKTIFFKISSSFLFLLFLSLLFPHNLQGNLSSLLSSFLAKWVGKGGVITFSLLLSFLSLYPGFYREFKSLLANKGTMESENFLEPDNIKENESHDLFPYSVTYATKADTKYKNKSHSQKNLVKKKVEKEEREVHEAEKHVRNEERGGKEQDKLPPPGFEVSHEALLGLLNRPPLLDTEVNRKELEEKAKLIEEKLAEFKVRGKVVDYYPGPVVTRYEFEPAPGIKLSRVVSLADDLALRMKVEKIRIVAPLPGKGLIGIEVPNEKRRTVYLSELVSTEEFKKLKSKLAFALGVDTAGYAFYADLAKMPHLLIAGATGSGKSVSINTIITSILFRASPEEVRFLMIDPKRIELSFYDGIPHLLAPVVKDRAVAGEVLKRAVDWMDLRYRHFAKDGVKDIESHNKKARQKGEETLPYIVIIIDEFADLMLTLGKQIEEPLARLAQMARAVGIHLVVATQRPSVDVITGTIKANFPVRIAFKVASRIDSRTILDEIGAEKLLGKGDMLFIPPGSSEPVRLHGPYISEDETQKIARTLSKRYLASRLKEYFGNKAEAFASWVVENGLLLPFVRLDEPGLEELAVKVAEYISHNTGMEYNEVMSIIREIRETYYIPIQEMEELPVEVTTNTGSLEEVEDEFDEMLEEAAKTVYYDGKASATLLQRKLKIGFARAARIIDQLEKLEIVGPPDGSKPRKLLVQSMEELEEKLRKARRKS